MHSLRRPHCQRVPQLRILGKTYPESTGSNLFITTAYLIIELLVPVRVRSNGLPTPHPHGQQGIYGLWYLAACDKSSAKLLDQLPETLEGTLPQLVKPSHSCRTETRQENLAHRPIIMIIKQHHMYIVTYMLNQVSISVINGEWRASKPPPHLNAFYFLQERRSGFPTQRSAHCIEGHVMITMLTLAGRLTTLLICHTRPFT